MQTDAKFLHYRELDDEGKVLPNGGATVAYTSGENGITYAIAWCNEIDNYNKAYGRAKSAGRLLSAKFSNPTNHTDTPAFISQMDTYMDEFFLARR